MIRDDGMFQCDFCGEDTGPFNDAGNHPVCVELAASQARVKELEEALRAAKRDMELCIEDENHNIAEIDAVLRDAALAEKGKQL